MLSSLHASRVEKLDFHTTLAFNSKTSYINTMTGTIKKLTDKGFGFISAEGLGKDLFFHSNALVGVQFSELHEGDQVTFETAESPKGPNAVNVKRA